MYQSYTEKLQAFYRRHRRMPSYTEMTILFGFKSKNAVYRLVGKLVSAGIITKDTLGRIIPSAQFDSLPFAGSVKAGLPSEALEQKEHINIESFLIKEKEKTYLLEVDGDSMINAHITDGDIAIIERINTAKNGDIVIANVDGEFTMKYFRTDGPKVWLEAANDAYAPIHPERELTIVGIVRGVMRKY